MSTLAPELDSDAWNGDALERRKFAEWLLGALVSLSDRAGRRSGEGIAICLDGDWGSGKSFFLRGFAKTVEASGYAAIDFNSWVHDLGDGSAAPLMAVIDERMRELIGDLPAKASAKSKALDAWSSAKSRFRRSLLPASKVFASGLARKLVGTGIDELAAAMSGTAGKTDDGEMAVVDAALDKLMSQMLDAHRERVEAIEQFNKKFGEACVALAEAKKVKLPLFVLVDELDRCRPTYAISVLEEMKHLFRVPGVCFVVATNLDQVEKAVCAVYGNSFDGRRYLERFFDRRYSLPSVDLWRVSREALTQLHEPSVSSWTRERWVGLHDAADGGQAVESFKFVDDAMSLDLRSQKKIVEIAQDVIAGLPSDAYVHGVWLFFLSALWLRHPDLFSLVEKGEMNSSQVERLRGALPANPSRRFRSRSRDGSFKENAYNIVDVLSVYLEASTIELTALRTKVESAQAGSFPRSILNTLIRELPQVERSDQTYWASTSRYAQLIRFAGGAHSPDDSA